MRYPVLCAYARVCHFTSDCLVDCRLYVAKGGHYTSEIEIYIHSSLFLQVNPIQQASHVEKFTTHVEAISQREWGTTNSYYKKMAFSGMYWSATE